MTQDLAETILRDVRRYTIRPYVDDLPCLLEADVLAALTAAMDPAIADRAGEVLSRLRKADEYEPLGHDGWEAADLITALLAQNAALRAERDELAAAIEQLDDKWDLYESIKSWVHGDWENALEGINLPKGKSDD